MEELQELAVLQATISMLSCHSLSSQSSSDDLLLAKFVLLLVELCKDVDDMSRKCSLVASRLQQISDSSVFLEDLFHGKKGDICGKDEMARGSAASPFNVGEVAFITLGDMERANSTLEDFCRSYFMFHGVDGQSAGQLFKHFPVLAFVESFIYQIDERKEDLLLCKEVKSKAGASEDEWFQPLYETLYSRKLWTTRIQEQLTDGIQYWNIEKSLCSSLLLGEEISLSDVMRAIKLKSFDYRVLNLLLYRLLDQPVNEAHMEFLSASELLVEISDDLFDYEEDVLHNSFNILRMFLRIFGPVKAPHMLAQVISDAEDNYKELLEKLEPTLAFKYQIRCQQAVIEGGASCSPSHPMGSWTIPPLIVNEQMYREQFGRV